MGYVPPPFASFVPTVLPWRDVLGHGADARIVLSGLLCWPDTVTIELVLAVRGEDLSIPELFGSGPDGPRLEVEFGAARASTDVAWRTRARTAEPGEPVLFPGGGSGAGGDGRGCYRQSVHLHPLPPDGPFGVTVAWPARGIGPRRTELDGSAVRAAAGRAFPLWP